MTEPSLPQESLFLQALEMSSPAERAAFLDRACGGDHGLRAEVESLLRADARSGDLLDLPERAAATADEPVRERPGTVIGPYKLLQVIGEGGMGTVWMAEQTQPVQRKVALKVIKAGMGSGQVVARFEAERQALAMMDHVNIARVLDAGATEAGLPYFVMELVHGIPITRYCDDNQLTPRERLELFVPVCQAIQHAHQKGVIHRDIKPSNVMITLYDGKAVPKVIDFGVAKATEQKLTERTLFTQYGTMVGTLEYMSPEQAEMSALGVDTRSDIFSLGVLLYELLTGSTPLTRKRLKEAAYAEVLRLIKEEEPPRPSTRLSDSGEALVAISANRHTEPAKLTKLVRGELDWIVMKTLEKDRTRRYDTANGFAADVLRYLNDEPVLACPPSAGYRFRKFARRNRTALTMVTVVAIALLLGIVATTWQAVRATRERDRAITAEDLAQRRLKSETLAHKEADASFRKARQAVDEYFILVSESTLLDVPGLQPLRKELLEAALRYYQAMLDQRANDPAVLADLAVAYMRVGGIYHGADRNDDALAAIESGLKAAERLRRDYPHAVEHHRALGGLWKVNRISITGTRNPRDPAAAHRTLIRFLQLWEVLGKENPSVEGFQNDLAYINTFLGLLESGRGEPAAFARAITHYRKAVNIWEQFTNAHPQVAAHRENLAGGYSNLAWALSLAGQHDQAGVASARGESLREQLFAQFPDVPRYRAARANSVRGLAGSLAATQPREAEKAYRQAMQVWQQLATDFPAAVEYRMPLAATQLQLAELLAGPLKRPEDALDAYRQCIHQREKLAAEFPEHGKIRSELGWSYQKLAEFLGRDPGRAQEAEELIRRSVSTFEHLARDFPDHPTWPEHLGHVLRVHAFASWRLGRLGEAEKYLREAIVLLEKSTARFPAWVKHRSMLADTCQALGAVLVANDKPDDAEKSFRKAIELYEKHAAEFHGRPADQAAWTASYMGLIKVLAATDRPQEAEPALRKYLERSPKSAAGYNDAAWVLATFPQAKLRDPGRAVELARKAVGLSAKEAVFWGTLGIAHYRTGDWKAAQAALDKSIELGFDRGSNRFFLAMTHWKLGNKEEAGKWFEKAVAWMEKYQSKDEELRRFRTEAADLMGVKKK